MSERRHFPRFAYEQPVVLIAQGGERHHANTVDISMLGFGVLVSRGVAQSLAQAGSVVMPGDRLQVIFSPSEGLPLSQDLLLDCRVRHARRLSAEEYFIAALFEEPGEGRRSAIAALVQQARSIGLR